MLSIEQLDNNKFKVLEGHTLIILTREQLIEMLKNPPEKVKEPNFQEQLEEFWKGEPIYPRM